MDGLAHAGGKWDVSKYKTIIPDSDNIIPICVDEYFDDDIAGRFVEFVRFMETTKKLDLIIVHANQKKKRDIFLLKIFLGKSSLRLLTMVSSYTIA